MKSKYNWLLSVALAMTVQVGIAQEKTLTGVVQEAGMPLPGVSVMLKGTSQGTQTDLDGRYSLKVKPGDVLVFSFIGMDDVTHVVGQEAFYNANFTQGGGTELDNVVVLAYGQQRTKNEVTGNVVAVKGDVVANTPVTSVDQALQGRVAGLQMSTVSGSPGAIQDIRIRGINSMSATNQPLYVVDGIPMHNDNISGNGNGTTLAGLSTINSDDVESMTVLKDAAATSAYGARGSNGVILITTKKGKSGKTNFNFKSSVGFQNLSRKGFKYLDGHQKEELFLEGIYNDYGKGGANFTRDKAYDFAKRNNLTANLDNWKATGMQRNDWKKALENKDAQMTILNFSASGGSERGTFYGSMGYEKFDGITKGGDFKKISGSFNFTRKLSDKFDITVGAQVSNVSQMTLLEGGAYFSNPNLTGMFKSPWDNIYNADGSYNIDPTSVPNTLYIVENNDYLNDVTRVISNNALGYRILDNLKFTSSIGLDYTLANYKTYYNPIYGDGVSTKGSAFQSDTKGFNYVWQNSLDYRFYLGENHRFDAKALTEFQKKKTNYISAGGEVLPPGMKSVGTAAANYSGFTSFTDWSQFSILGMVNYSYANKYLLDVTVRREGSSRFSKDDRWGTFYAVGGAWNISSEDFLKDVEGIDLLRLRGSFGTTGNSTVGLNSYQQYLGAGTYNGESALYATQFGGEIGWETQTKFDVGVEFGLFNNRLTGNVAYFNSKSKDLLYSLPLSMTSGFSSQTMNVGEMRNTGVEVELNYDIFRDGDFKWSIGGNFGTVKNEVVKMPLVDGKPLEVKSSFKATQEGKAINTWYLREYAGVDPDNGDALWYRADGTTTNKIAEAEYRFQNNSALPKVTGGIHTDFSYKGFNLSALFTFATGYSIYDYWHSYTATNVASTVGTYNGTTGMLDRWQNPGDITNVPRMAWASSDYTSPHTGFLYKGDHIRLRQITFGYDFQSNVVKTLGVDGVNLSVSALNPFTWVRDKGLKGDPEVGASGYIEMATPGTKSVMFTLNVKF